MSKLNQFKETQRSCQIVGFPFDPELFKVRMIARTLETKNGKAADKYWQTECRRLHASLSVQGKSKSEANQRVSEFAESVHHQMQVAAWAAWSSERAAWAKYQR